MLDRREAPTQAAVTRLIDAYREIGHYLADLDPLKLTPRQAIASGLLEPSAFGSDRRRSRPRPFHTKLFDPPQSPLRDLLAALQETYCRSIGVEFMHIRNPQVRDLARGADGGETRNRPNLDIRQKRRIILKLNAAELFETFLAHPLRRRQAVLARRRRDS